VQIRAIRCEKHKNIRSIRAIRCKKEKNDPKSQRFNFQMFGCSLGEMGSLWYPEVRRWLVSSKQASSEVNILSDDPLLSTSAPDKLLHEIVRRLVEGMNPVRIILFGSHAYGKPGKGSDFDLMIIVPESDQPPHRRAQFAYACVGAIGVPKDLMVLTEEEFERQSHVVTSLARLIKEQGRVLYERGEKPRDSQLATQVP